MSRRGGLGVSPILFVKEGLGCLPFLLGNFEIAPMEGSPMHINDFICHVLVRQGVSLHGVPQPIELH